MAATSCLPSRRRPSPTVLHGSGTHRGHGNHRRHRQLPDASKPCWRRRGQREDRAGLVQFDDAILQAQRRQAEASLRSPGQPGGRRRASQAAAQANLDQVKAGARPQEIEAEQQAVVAAQGRVTTAEGPAGTGTSRAAGRQAGARPGRGARSPTSSRAHVPSRSRRRPSPISRRRPR